ncbi:MAG TPA: bifunctional [glutamate--ammonia ligase]-adenylyl-L-tyrosine phosphorylase/[glutamate--ammonia-ligase] adenylyltransferase [Candidatus Desulfofervidus auxilii]|uniref:Bifunctional [glutamate--ammonia ligase]-adenylyl-L-tyrosine phosphorylase/[glutamate--ammonia-ligase] adenylyltransferase n=1 Tax=Desulfofervidus auxilii TaxID=1621989 RepID=A0A7C0U355_DESA2|nr:bifunctional [glutamate--ammonia ligase]-adenylyl-L-tyrosine phosphorylase/[glutamate--ammonia-ligase] adenylyltransferase [Candidatus Desulfofervidus auxilii]
MNIYKNLSRHVLWHYGETAFKRVLEVQSKEIINFLDTYPEKAKQLLRICVSSSYLVNLLIRKPYLLSWLFLKNAISQRKTKEDFLKELRKFIHQPDFPQKLRYFKAKEYLRLWARDINQICSLESSLAELSALAEACVQACFEYALNLLQNSSDKFFILGLGKLGAEELNFYSDIDIIYLYDGHCSLETHYFFIKLAKTITKILQDPSYGEIVFKVDLGLRPGGKESEIVQSTRAVEIFYENFGTTLERMALLRARPIAGAITLGENFLKTLNPFIYRRYLDYTGVEEIRALKKAIDFRSHHQKTFNIKLGQGGIRELEFFIHTLQLIYGGKYPFLRQYNTFKAISALKEAQIIKSEEAEGLTRAYRYLRRLEHLCQMASYCQTHILPTNKNTLLKIVRLMGYVQRNEEKALEAFYLKLEKTTSFVHRLFKELLYTPEEEVETDKLLLKSFFTNVLLEEEAISYLKNLGFKNPQIAYKIIFNLKGVFKTRHTSIRARELFISLLPKLLKEIAQTLDPDLGLVHLEQFVSRIGPRTGFYATLKENPSLRKLLLQIFGASRLLSSLLIKHFQLLDSLIDASQAFPIKTKKQFEISLNTAIQEKIDLDEKMEALRHFKNEEFLRIGFHDLAGKLNYLQVSYQLSLLAELCLKQALTWAKEEVNKSFSLSDLPFAIIALGKLGSHETAYHSDLDLIFIYDYPLKADISLQQNAHVYFVKVAQRLISILTLPHIAGPGYKIDTRLRPSGRFGPLVVSLQAFKDYYLNQAQPWEYQILLKARAIAGDKNLIKKWEDLRQWLLFEKKKNINWQKEIKEMRERILIERAKETKDKFNPKLGKGGFIEIDFLMQYLQLSYGKDYPILQHRHTLKVLKAAKELNLIKNVDILIEGYNFLKALEHRLNLLYDCSSDTLITEENLKDIWQHWGLKKPPFKIPLKDIWNYYQRLRVNIRKIWENLLN